MIIRWSWPLRKSYTQLHQSITSHETQTDSPNVCLFKQAHSQAKIISKVIHQPNPESLTQTTVSANTDGAIHCSEGNTDLICHNLERMNSDEVEKYWLQMEFRKNMVIFFSDSEMRNVRIKLLSGMTTFCTTLTPFLLILLWTSARGNGGYSKPGFLWPEQKKASQHINHLLHQMPVMVHWCFCREAWWNVRLLHPPPPEYLYSQKFATLLALEPHRSTKCTWFMGG